ncbi:MAG: NAD(P)-dependent oxidoreductase [Chloroflexota bacterium]|nr:NAD(P)-dependent oxidoreductase [Chloroflexota bacterium]
MTTLVTGGTGFVASNIVRKLVEQGEQVVAFDILPPSDLLLAYVKPWARRVTFIQGDILNRTDLELTREHGITKIVHAAVFTGILPHIEAGRSKDIVNINMMGTTNVLELARLLSVQRFIYVSSGSVYGDDHPDSAVTEASIPRPHTLYAVTKYASELVTRRYGELHNFPTVSVRLGSPFGPMERVTGHRANQSLLKEWTGSIVRGLPIKVGDQSVERAFTYVLDIAGGICAVVNSPSLSYDVYNVSTGDKISLKQIIAVLRELHPDLQVLDSIDLGPPPHGGNFMKSDRLTKDLGFYPQYDLRSGLKEYLGWRMANDVEV